MTGSARPDVQPGSVVLLEDLNLYKTTGLVQGLAARPGKRQQKLTGELQFASETDRLWKEPFLTCCLYFPHYYHRLHGLKV
jgi:hypothetical protein